MNDSNNTKDLKEKRGILQRASLLHLQDVRVG